MSYNRNSTLTKTLTACAVALAFSTGSNLSFAQLIAYPVKHVVVEDVQTSTDLSEIFRAESPENAWKQFLADRTAYASAGTATAQNNSLTILPVPDNNTGKTTSALQLYFWAASAQSEVGSVLAQNNRFDVTQGIRDIYGAIVTTKGIGNDVTAAVLNNVVNVDFDDEFISNGEVVGGYVGKRSDSPDCVCFNGSLAQANGNTVTVNAPNMSYQSIVGGEIVASNRGNTQTLEANGNHVTVHAIAELKYPGFSQRALVISSPFVTGAYIDGMASDLEKLNISHIRTNDNVVELYDAALVAFASRIEYSYDHLDYDIATQNNRLFVQAEGKFLGLVTSDIDVGGIQGQIFAVGNTLKVEGVKSKTIIELAAATNIKADFTETGSIIASGNRVQVDYVDANKVYGVLIDAKNVDSLTASDNTVVVRNSAVNQVFGIQTLSVKTAQLSNNTIVIEDSEINDYVFGIVFDSRTIARSTEESSTNVSISGNHLYIVNSHIGPQQPIEQASPDGNLAGNVHLIASDTLDNIQNNSITVVDSTISDLLSVTAKISEESPQPTHTSDYRLHFSGTNRVGAIAGFDTLTFTVDKQNIDNDKPVLTLTGANMSGTFGESDRIIVYVPEGLEGKNYQLIAMAPGNTDTLTLTGATLTVETPFYTQTSKLGNLTLTGSASGDIQKTELSTGEPIVQDALASAPKVVNGNAKTLSETLLGTVAFVQQGAEFIADEGLVAMDAVATADTLTAFGAMHGGSNKYLTGSDVEVDGVTLATGIATKVGNHTLAAFVEAGWAESDSHVAGTKAEGDHDYFGIGVAARLHLTESLMSDLSLRMGRSTTKYQGIYAKDAATYDSSVYYATAHAGLGLDIPITENWTGNVYGRYSVSFIDGDDVNLTGQSKAVFDMSSTVTHAVRVGARVKAEVTENIAVNVGLAYEHVFNGDASGRVQGVAIDEPSLEGDTGILELGMTVKPSAESPWSVNFGAKGYAGDRQGVSGNLTAVYRF